MRDYPSFHVRPPTLKTFPVYNTHENEHRTKQTQVGLKMCWWWWWIFPSLWGFWDNVWPFIPCLHFVLVVVLFKVEISLRTLIPLFSPVSVHSGSANWVDCGQVFPDEWAHFQIGSHTMSGQQHSQPTPTSLVKDVCMFRCNLTPALLAEWPGPYSCHCGNMGVEWTLNKSQHTKLTPKKKILVTLLPGFKSQPFIHKSSALPTSYPSSP